MDKLNCKNCGRFLLSKDERKKFCNWKCFQQFRKKQFLARVKNKHCKFCCKPLKGRQLVFRQEFCSCRCRGLAGRILEPRICLICQKFLTYKQLQKKQIYCSRKCQHIADGLQRKGKCGPFSRNWKNGISFEPYDSAFNDELKDLIRKRDKYHCQLCKAPQIEFFGKLPVHHIDYDKKNSDPLNLIALCISCNSRVNKDRKSWQRFFTEYQKERLKAGKIQFNSKKKEKGGEKIWQHHFQAICKEGKRKSSCVKVTKSIEFRQSHQESGETPGLYQGNPNVKARAILRGASSAETEMMEDSIYKDKSMSSIIRRASSDKEMKR